MDLSSFVRAEHQSRWLGVLAREYLLAGHLIDRAGMPLVLRNGIDAMRAVAIEEWMGASPIYTKRMQRLLGFDVDTVEAAMKGMQLDIGAPPEFMDFRFTVHDDHHGEFHLDHCGALMDVEPMGEQYVVTMCHDIEDPTFDATAWATNPRMRMRPIHRPPRDPADRHPHCAWTVTIDSDDTPAPTPPRSLLVGGTHAARLPLAKIGEHSGDGFANYSHPLDPDLVMEDFASSTLLAILEEVALQGHLLVLSFASVLAEGDPDGAMGILAEQFTGVAGVVAGRIREALDLGPDAAGLAAVFELHPAFAPRTYVDLRVGSDGDSVSLELGDCPALRETVAPTWLSVLAAGDQRPLQAVATAVDPYWEVVAEGPRSWRVRRGSEPQPESREVALVRFSSGADFRFADRDTAPGGASPVEVSPRRRDR